MNTESKELVVLETEIVPERKMQLPELFKEDTAEKLIAEIEKAVNDFEYDETTKEGRAAAKSLAAKVSSTRAQMDRWRQELKGSLQEKIAPVLDQIEATDKVGKSYKDRLAALRDKAKERAVQWEAEEQARKDKIAQRLYDLRQTTMFQIQESRNSDLMQSRLDSVRETVIDESWEELQEEAQIAKDNAIAILTDAVEQAKAFEEQAARVKELEEQQRQEEAKRREEQAAELARQQERERIERAQKAKERQEEEERKAKEREDLARQQDRDHRAKIHREARDDIMANMGNITADDDAKRALATEILTAITKDKVRHVTIRY